MAISTALLCRNSKTWESLPTRNVLWLYDTQRASVSGSCQDIVCCEQAGEQSEKSIAFSLPCPCTLCYTLCPWLNPWMIFGVTKLTRMKIFFWKSSKFFWVWISFPACQQVNFFHSQTLFARGTKTILCPWTSSSLPLAMGKDPMTAGNSFTCFLVTWLQELQSRKDNLYCETHNKRSEFITEGLLIYTRLCKIQTRLYSAAIHINAHQWVQERF